MTTDARGTIVVKGQKLSVVEPLKGQRKLRGVQRVALLRAPLNLS